LRFLQSPAREFFWLNMRPITGHDSAVIGYLAVVCVLFALTLALLLSSLLLLVLAVNGVAILRSVVNGFLHVAYSFLCFTLDLLRGAFDLSVGVSGPFANLALDAACRVVDCSFYLILIHDSTSVDSCFGYRTVPLVPVWPIWRGRCRRGLSIKCAHIRAQRAALRPVISWMTSTTSAITRRM